MTRPDPSSESGDLVRALSRGLTLISVLNQFNGLTVRELALRADLPEPTTIRLLKTLAEEGYVVRSAADRRFRLSRHVRDLNSGYRAPAWIDAAARPVAERLQSALVWPVTVVAMIDDRLWPCVYTDSRCGLLHKRSIGPENFPVLTTAVGWLFLALLPAEASARLLAQARREEDPAITDAAVAARIAPIRADGHAVYPHADHTVVSAPIARQGEVVGALAVRHEHAAPLPAAQIETYARSLKQAAAEIAGAMALSEPPAPRECAGTTPDLRRRS